jgi:hypothetical protein
MVPADSKASIMYSHRKMKTLSRQLKQAFDALEFTNISQLNELTAKLNPRDRSDAATAQATKSKAVSPHVNHTPAHAS